MAELIGINDTWLRWKSYTNVKDYNVLVNPGLYQVQKNENTLNAPPIYGIIEVLGGISNTSIIQRVTDTTGETYVRGLRIADGTWSPWREL